ncbi:hypothetical protein [Nonomuraea sp. NPDC050202]|uniref:hypothetical protein n=1 Tax=Nonomuraea sp. NPDC050202 TaxID=3155035 RepID=UPI0033D6D71B
MTTTDPFAYPAESDGAAVISANHAATAKELVGRADDKLLKADLKPEPGSRAYIRESAMRDVEMAKVFAMLAINANLTALRVEVRQVATLHWEVDKLTTALTEVEGTLDHDLGLIVDALQQRPRWWQFRLRRELRQQAAVSTCDPEGAW